MERIPADVSVRERLLVPLRPLERQRKQEFQPRRAGFGLGERHLLPVVVDRRMVRADRVDRAVDESRAYRLAVAHAAQGRNQPAIRIEPADVDVAQVQMIDRHVATHLHARALRLTHA